MSPETNGNNPPTIAERKKKKRDKKHSSTSGIDDSNIPPCNGIHGNLSSYPNLSTQDNSFYPSFFNYPTSSEPMSLPVYPTNYPSYSFFSNPNLSYPGSFLSKPNFPHVFPSYSVDSNDYLSLPLVNVNQNETDKRRFSDPGPNDSDSSSTSIDNRVVQKLTHQINILKEANRNLTRELNEIKMEVNLLKQQQLNSKHYEREYEPGMIAEFIRDLREAARVREDALMARVKHMIEEKQLSMTPFGSGEFMMYIAYLGTLQFQLGMYCRFGNNITVQAQEIAGAIWESDWLDTTITYKKMMIFTMQRMQVPIIFTIGKFAPLTLNTFSANQFQVVSEKSRNNDRLSKLEEQIKNLSLNHSRSEDVISSPSSSTLEDANSSAHQVIELEREALQLRRELQDARAKKEESDQKLQQLDKKLSHLLRRKETSYETSDDCKTSTCSAVDSFSTGSASTGPITGPQRVTLSGPVTDL